MNGVVTSVAPRIPKGILGISIYSNLHVSNYSICAHALIRNSQAPRSADISHAHGVALGVRFRKVQTLVQILHLRNGTEM